MKNLAATASPARVDRKMPWWWDGPETCFIMSLFCFASTLIFARDFDHNLLRKVLKHPSLHSPALLVPFHPTTIRSKRARRCHGTQVQAGPRWLMSRSSGSRKTHYSCSAICLSFVPGPRRHLARYPVQTLSFARTSSAELWIAWSLEYLARKNCNNSRYGHRHIPLDETNKRPYLLTS